MELTSQWAAALEPNILQWTHDGMAEHPDTISNVFRVKSETSGVIRLHDSGGPRLITKGTEGANSTEIARVKGYESVTAPQIFKSKMSASWEYVRRGRYDDIKQDASDLGRSTTYTLNLYGNQLFIQGFTSTATFYGDAKPLFSVGHTRPDGGTAWSNASSTGITLTEANLETGVLALKQQVSHTGRKLAIGSGNIVLMVPEALEKEAVIITGSTLRSGTGNNDTNWYKGKFNVYVNPFIGADTTDLDGNTGSDTAWFLLDPTQHGLEFFYEMRPSYKSWENDDADVMYTKVYFSCRPLWSHPRGVWGSKGDGSAYSS